MAKQKVKNPRKANLATRAKNATESVVSEAIGSVKRGAKRKVRIRQDQTGPSAERRSKGARKIKIKGAQAAPLASLLNEVTRPIAGARPSKVPSSPAKAPRKKARLGRLERLEIAVDEVRLGGRLSPRTRKLQLSGVPKMAQKLIEEAGEAAIEALQGNTVGLVNESVDLLYNLVVLLAASGVTVDMLWAEMDRRELTLGMAEKLPKIIDPDG